MSQEEAQSLLSRLENAKKQANMIKESTQPTNNPYGAHQMMSSEPFSGGGVSAVHARLANQSVIGNGMLAQKIFGIDAQGNQDGCCPKSGPCPAVNPLVGPSCQRSCQVTSTRNSVERSYLQNNNAKTNYPGLMN